MVAGLGRLFLGDRVWAGGQQMGWDVSVFTAQERDREAIVVQTASGTFGKFWGLLGTSGDFYEFLGTSGYNCRARGRMAGFSVPGQQQTGPVTP